MSEMKRGVNYDGVPRCPPHPGFVRGLCFLCGVKEEHTEGGAPAVAVGHEIIEMMKQGGDDHGNEEDTLCSRFGAKEEEAAEGGAPGVAVGYEMMKQGGGGGRGANGNTPSCPPHPGFFLGFCYGCGAIEENAGGSVSTVTAENIHGDLETPALAAATSIAGASDLATLFRERKLILVLDLDHTLLNSTRLDVFSPLEQRNGFTRDTEDELHMDLFRLEYGNLRRLTKLRPFVRDFLEQASALFEMHVYTMGIQAYARAVVDLLDPDGVYFGGRVVSREESTSPQTGIKSLDDIRGAEAVAVVILDDTDVAWPEHQDNLILVDRYHYFSSTCRRFGYHILSLAELRRDEREHDGSLAVVLGVLKRVHQRFFDGHRADVREVIREVQREVLPGCTVAFSYLEDWMEDFPEEFAVWTVAERFGAVCKKDVDETVTHVVAEDPGTQKAQWARDHGKFLVNPEWIKASSFRWCRQDEQAFPVTARAS